MKRILLALLIAATATIAVSAQANAFIKAGATLYWKASTGDNGTLKVVTVSGSYFQADQTNERNKAAGVQKLHGAFLNNGSKIVLLNVGQWKEVWEGDASANSVAGSIKSGSSSFTFTISAAPEVSTAPFIVGKTLKWKSNAAGGQNGSIKVTSVNGSTFTIEQRNDKNLAAGVTKMDGEIKNGMFYLYNRAWNETWIGTLSNGVLSGKINEAYTFQISE